MISRASLPARGTFADDRALFEHIRARANVKPALGWEAIAAELGLTVADLLDWFVTYRSPKRGRPALERGPALLARSPAGGQWPLGGDAQRLANWSRAASAARAQREIDR